MDNGTESEKGLQEFISRQDLVYGRPPTCWQGGLVLGNGGLGAVFYAKEALEWLVNKADVIDARVLGVKRVIPRDEAERMVKQGTSAEDFDQAERGKQGPEGAGPKTYCRLTMDMGMIGGMPDIHSRLCLYDATLRLDLDKHLSHPRMESFVRADEDMLVIRASNVSPMISYRTRIFFSRPEDIELEKPELWLEGNRMMMRMNMPEGVSYVAGLEVVPKPSAAYRDTMLLHLREKYRAPLKGTVTTAINGCFGLLSVGGDFELFLTVATARDSRDPAATVRGRLDKILSSEYPEIRKNHDAWWRDFWGRSRVELEEKKLERFFYLSLYALGCSYRKAPLSGLLGLCYGPSVGPLQITPWMGDLHHDLNVQCPFFPVHVLNHSDLFDAYLETYHEFLPQARRLAREVWGVDGAHFDMGFNALGKSVMGGVGMYRFFFGGSYVALMHCLSWRSRRDEERMRDRIYPFLREIIRFYQNMMSKGTDGRYHLYPAHVCELNVMDTGDPVQVISMLKVCLQTAIEGAVIVVEKDEKLVNGWRELLKNLPEYRHGVDNKGRKVVLDGDKIPADHHVGQAGCLHPVYPCGEVDEFSGAESLALYNSTLDSVVEKTAQVSYADADGYHYQCVWQCFFRAMTGLRLGRTAEFHEHYLPMFFRAYVKPNGLVSHDSCVIVAHEISEKNLGNIPDESLLDVGEDMPKFEPWHGSAGGATPNPIAKEMSVGLIEGSSDYLTMITECLLQSHNGIIRVFPGWPKDKGARFENLIAEGDVCVSSAIDRGEVAFIKLTRGENCRLSSVRIKSPWTGKLETHKFPENGCLTLGNA